jgi:uncharacterized protein (UPF0335 family)
MEQPAGNGFDREVLGDIVNRIEDQLEELLKLRSDYMLQCKGPRGRIKSIYAEAKEHGIPRKELRLVVEERESSRRLAARFAELEADEQAQVEMIREALGPFANTPLGQAAISRAERQEQNDQTLDTLTQ